MTSARDAIAWAADIPLPDALALYPRMARHVGLVKVGLSLFVQHGPAAVKSFSDMGAAVFLDLKLHDIPQTVELAAAGAARLGVRFLTVHSSGGPAMLEAALRGARMGAQESGHSPPRILAVTALTSLSDDDVMGLGFGSSAAAMATRLAQVAVDQGIDGLVCSAQEAAALRALFPKVFLCTPGIRSAGDASGDQERIATPQLAMRAGSNLLVVGRPLHAATSPELAAESLAREVALAMGTRDSGHSREA